MRVVAGDIGGTKTLLGVFEKRPAGWVMAVDEHYASREGASFTDLAERFWREHGVETEVACFGVAGPVHKNRVRATNLPWTVDGDEVAARLGIRRVRLINDFAAQSLGVLEIEPGALVPVNPGASPPDPDGAIAVIGAGTGLGEATMLRVGGRPVVTPGEGGHADFAPRNDLEIDLLRYLSARFGGHVSWERILSGQGLVNVYEFLRDSGRAVEHSRLRAEIAGADDAAPLISRAALEGWDPHASAALDLFVSVYGAEAGNLALRALARGGVYVTGGIAAKILPRLTDGRFLAAFTEKGRLATLARQFPVSIVLNPHTGLLGAAAEAARLAEE